MQYSDYEKIIIEKVGIDPVSLGNNNVQRIINSLIVSDQNQASDEESIVDSKNEIQKLIEEVVVPETWFFRDSQPFILLKNIVQNWMKTKSGGVFRVLSAPCSTGEEPYSIAMTLLEAGLSAELFCIDAIDISKKALALSQNAVYPKTSFREKDFSVYEKYFTQTESGMKLSGNVVGSVNFHCENFTDTNFLPGFSPYQVIFCRNLLIYLTNDARMRLLKNVERLLIKEGVLFSGYSELTFFLNNGFHPVKHAKSFACRRNEVIKIEQKKHMHEKKIKSTEKKIETIIKDNKSQITNYSSAVKIEEVESIILDNKITLQQIQLLADNGNFSEAMKLCDEFIENNVTNPDIYFIKGLIFEGLSNLNSAIENHSKSIYLKPDHYEAVLHLSLLFRQKGDLKKAELYKLRADRLYENKI